MAEMIDTPPDGFRFFGECKHYCVNDCGIVLSNRTRGGRLTRWKPMRLILRKDGRIAASLRVAGYLSTVQASVHRLVLMAFVGPCPDGMEACHNDGNPLNNHVSNLRWDSHKNNMVDRAKHGRNVSGSKNGSAILDEAAVLKIRDLNKQGMMQKEIAPLFGVSKQAIQTVCSRTNWSHI